MPAIITHDTFAHEVYDALFALIGSSRDEAEAFLLGNQGPDPLFYAVANPRVAHTRRLGSLMHAERPNETFAAVKRSVANLPAPDQPIGRAYALGFLCHYLLDSTAHPLIYSFEYALCDAGEPGLSRKNGTEVHAFIERELDEMVLTVRRGQTIASFNPSNEVLKASDHVLDIVSSLYDEVAREVFDWKLPPATFKASVKAFRRVQAALYSPDGFKRTAIGRVETLARPYSLLRAMSHINHALYESTFDNHEHAEWVNPFTNKVATTSFLDLFDSAAARAADTIALFDAAEFDEAAARAITHDLNFSGTPVCN